MTQPTTVIAPGSIPTGCFAGVWTAIVTPFNSDSEHSIDFESLNTLIDFQIAQGVAGLVAAGSTGEAATLTEQEYFAIVSAVVRQTRGRVPVLAGIGASATSIAVERAEKLRAAGVAGILLTAPPYNKPPQRGIIAHFEAVQRASGLPVVCYNIPGRVGVNIIPTTIAALFASGTIVAVKESSGSIDQVLELLAVTRGELPVLSGEDAQVLPVLACGGRGVISACANIAPRTFCDLLARFAAGDYPAAQKLQWKLLPLVKAMFLETNPIPLKYALFRRELLKAPVVRLPLVPLSAEASKAVDALCAAWEFS